MTAYHRPITEPPAPQRGASYRRPAGGPQPPGPDDCPLCHDYNLWPAEWRKPYWLPPREQMCDVHVGQHDFLTAVYEWNAACEAGVRREREAAEARYERERAAAAAERADAASSGLLADA